MKRQTQRQLPPPKRCISAPALLNSKRKLPAGRRFLGRANALITIAVVCARLAPVPIRDRPFLRSVVYLLRGAKVVYPPIPARAASSRMLWLRLPLIPAALVPLKLHGPPPPSVPPLISTDNKRPATVTISLMVSTALHCWQSCIAQSYTWTVVAVHRSCRSALPCFAGRLPAFPTSADEVDFWTRIPL